MENPINRDPGGAEFNRDEELGQLTAQQGGQGGGQQGGSREGGGPGGNRPGGDQGGNRPGSGQ